MFPQLPMWVQALVRRSSKIHQRTVKEQTESQQTESDQGGDDGNEEEEEDSVKTASDPNQQDKRKTPEPEEVHKPHPRKKMKASKDKNIVEEAGLTSEELAQALSKSTEVLT